LNGGARRKILPPCTQFGYVYPFLEKTLNQPRVLNAGSTKNTNAFFALPAHLPV